jgi:hypothetical protein
LSLFERVFYKKNPIDLLKFASKKKEKYDKIDEALSKRQHHAII